MVRKSGRKEKTGTKYTPFFYFLRSNVGDSQIETAESFLVFNMFRFEIEHNQMMCLPTSKNLKHLIITTKMNKSQ